MNKQTLKAVSQYLEREITPSALALQLRRIAVEYLQLRLTACSGNSFTDETIREYNDNAWRLLDFAEQLDPATLIK